MKTITSAGRNFLPAAQPGQRQPAAVAVAVAKLQAGEGVERELTL